MFQFLQLLIPSKTRFIRVVLFELWRTVRCWTRGCQGRTYSLLDSRCNQYSIISTARSLRYRYKRIWVWTGSRPTHHSLFTGRRVAVASKWRTSCSSRLWRWAARSPGKPQKRSVGTLRRTTCSQRSLSATGRNLRGCPQQLVKQYREGRCPARPGRTLLATTLRSRTPASVLLIGRWCPASGPAQSKNQPAPRTPPEKWIDPRKTYTHPDSNTPTK